jgi:hypothetical protein
MRIRQLHLLWVAGACCAAATAQAQTQQVVKPPLSQAWIDVATFSGMGGMGMRPGASTADIMRGMFGGRGGGESKVPFGMTQSTMSTGRYVDVTVMSRTHPNMAEATQQVPAVFLSPALKLISPKSAPPAPAERDDEVVQDKEPPPKPEGKLYLYWGCGETVRPGQPKVLDFATASPSEMGQFFQSRRATARGAHSAVGRPLWPNDTDGRAVPEGARLAGEHQISGTGLPDNFRFQVPAAQDLMPAMAIRQADAAGALALSWNAVPAARAYFLAAMGSRGRNEMVIWTSSEVPETGFGLLDYQPNGAVDRWLREKVLLSPATTSCSVPKGVLTGEGAMIRAIAYGSDLSLAYPPRPTDPKIAWEPQWAVKMRVKSVTFTAVGMPSSEMAAQPDSEQEAAKAEQKKAEEKKPKLPSTTDLLRGVLGR